MMMLRHRSRLRGAPATLCFAAFRSCSILVAASAAARAYPWIRGSCSPSRSSRRSRLSPSRYRCGTHRSQWGSYSTSPVRTLARKGKSQQLQRKFRVSRTPPEWPTSNGLRLMGDMAARYSRPRTLSCAPGGTMSAITEPDAPSPRPAPACGPASVHEHDRGSARAVSRESPGGSSPRSPRRSRLRRQVRSGPTPSL